MSEDEQESGLQKLGQDPPVSGLERLEQLIESDKKETESDKEREEAESKYQLAVTKAEEQEKAFLKMVGDMKEFLDKSNSFKEYNLRLVELKPLEYLIYRGDLSDVWAWVRLKGCRFERTSLLRAILGLKDTAPLKKYFKNYSLRTGGKVL